MLDPILITGLIHMPVIGHLTVSRLYRCSSASFVPELSSVPRLMKMPVMPLKDFFLKLKNMLLAFFALFGNLQC